MLRVNNTIVVLKILSQQIAQHRIFVDEEENLNAKEKPLHNSQT